MVIIGCFIVASLAGLAVSRGVREPASDAVTVIVVWIAFYPISRLNPRTRWWAHWARGAIILVGFLIARRLFR